MYRCFCEQTIVARAIDVRTKSVVKFFRDPELKMWCVAMMRINGPRESVYYEFWGAEINLDQQSHLESAVVVVVCSALSDEVIHNGHERCKMTSLQADFMQLFILFMEVYNN
jgi:hypothetical protein